MSKCGPSWKQAVVPAVLWVGAVAAFAIPLAWMIIYAATQIARLAFDSGVEARGAGRFVALGESVLLACALVIVPVASGLAHRSWRVAGVASALTVAVSLAVGSVFYSFFLYYAKPVMMIATNRAARSETPTIVSDISADEEVVFFPTCAHLDENGRTWNVPIHGIIYEPEVDSPTRSRMVTAIGEMVDVEAGTPEAENLDRRVRLFLVDNERGEDVSVRIGPKVYKVGTSGPNGHFHGTIGISASEVENLYGEQGADAPFLRLEAVTRKSDNRRFVGRVRFVDPMGLSIISDIDDTIKHSQVGDHKAVLSNTFLHQFQAVPGMPELYGEYYRKGVVIHYVSGSPWQLYLPLSEFLEAEGLPPGSFDLKHFRLKDTSAIRLLQSQEAAKLASIERIITAFPKRRFVLIGDSGEEDPEIYAKVARRHGEQVVAILIRNVTAEQADGARFEAVRKGLADAQFRLFNRPAEIRPVLEELWHLLGEDKDAGS